MSRIRSLVLLALSTSFCLVCTATEPPNDKEVFASDDAKYSYVLGAQFAYTLKSQGVATIDIDMLTKALKDVLQDKPTLLTEKEIKATFQEFRQKAVQAARQKREAEAQTNLEAGQKFLEDNKTKEGVQVTESGLQYKVITAGTGVSPDADDKVKAHYRGTLIDGTQFDSSYDRGEPSSFSLNRVIKGWTEGLQLMKEGAKYQFYIPSDLAYGPRGNQNIPGNSTLIFDVELIKVTPQEAPKKRTTPQARPARK